jgi:hypothetical protein
MLFSGTLLPGILFQLTFFLTKKVGAKSSPLQNILSKDKRIRTNGGD